MVSIIFTTCTCFFMVTISYFLANRYRGGLSRFPGPALSSFTTLGTLYQTWKDGALPPYLHLHRIYGTVVRLGPSKLSFSEPQAVRDIYGTNGLNQKSEFHLAHQQFAAGTAIRTLFASTDLKWHDSVRRCVAPAYSMTSILQYEEHVSNSVQMLVAKLSARFADTEGPLGIVDFPKWLHYFADDTVNSIAYGMPLGHLEAGDDIEGLLAFGDIDSRYAILIGQAVWLQYFGRRNPVYLWAQRRGWLQKKEPLSVRFAKARQNQRRQLVMSVKDSARNERPCLTDDMIRAAIANPSIIGDSELLAMGLSLVAAGSDTTASSLSAMFYYLLRNPIVYSKLMLEIDEAFAQNGRPTLPYVEARKLHYLNACIKETFRMHPATRYAPERVTPKQGHVIAGKHIPGSTTVFVSAWVIHRNQEVYGTDANEFRPERWIEADVKNLKEMERMLSHFGSGGNHTCLGRNVALLEMYIAIPAILRAFKISLAQPEQKWRIKLGTFVSVTDFYVRLTKR